MKRYENYETTEAFTGDYEQLEPGGHICKILKVVLEEKAYGHLLRIGFDIAEGEHEGYYRRRFEHSQENNADAKWPGMYYQTVKAEDLRYFKGFMTTIEASNPGYKWDWNETKLKGKLFGGLFGQEEYIANDGQVKLSTKCRYIRTVEQTEKGVDVPEIKRLKESVPQTDIDIDGSDAELPF